MTAERRAEAHVQVVSPLQAGARERTRVAVLARVALYRDALQRSLAVRSLSLVGTASTFAEALQLEREHELEVLLLDMSTRDAPSLLARVRASMPKIKVVAFALGERDDDLLACAEAEVSGLVAREATPEQLVLAVESAVRGEMACSPRLAASLLRQVAATRRRAAAAPAPLSEREQQIGALLAEGLANKEIAVRLAIEVPTVKNHVHQILAKLRVQRRDQVASHFHNGAPRSE